MLDVMRNAVLARRFVGRKRKSMIEYVGNAPYCYANSAAMLLKSIGEDIQPGKIEVLTGVGLGAIWQDDGLFWLSNPYSPPDVGLSAALGILGFQFVEGSSEAPDPCPLEELEELLQTGPVVLGPLDMGYLDYLPFSAPGADHFVLAYQIANEYVFLHDPEGFPNVSLPFSKLADAWKAERVDYRRGYYRYWTAPARGESTDEDEIYARGIEHFTACYQQSEEIAAEIGWTFGPRAVTALADRAESQDLPKFLIRMMKTFHFCLGARRALDYAVFFDSRNSQLAEIKRDQARLLGHCHRLAAESDWAQLAVELKQFAMTEDAISKDLSKEEKTEARLLP